MFVPCSCKTKEKGDTTNNDGELQHGDISVKSGHAQNDVRSQVDNAVTTRTISPQTDDCKTDKDAFPSCGNLHC